MDRPYPFFWLLWTLPVFLCLQRGHSQNEDLTKDAEFFQQQKAVYQRWLDHSGLGATLRVHDLDVQPDQLSLYLAFPFEDIDRVMRSWEQLKTDFEREKPLSLERQLFYKMVNLMEVEQAMGNVQIYDTYDLSKEPLFMRAVYFEDGQVKVEESNPRSKIREVSISPTDLKEMKDMSVETFNQRFDRRTIYDNIYGYAKKRFEQNVCEGREPRVRLLENDEVLRFEVTDLCREVLTDEANPLLCRLLRNLGYECNWVKREMLVFTITHEETANGFNLAMEIDGKYGSGLYEKVRRGGYLSMEVDFNEYLENYADTFRECLRQIILYGEANCE